MSGAAAAATIRERVRRFVRDAFLVDDLRDDESFLLGGVIDSLGMMQLVAFLEAEYRVSITDVEIVPENFDTVERVALFVARKLTADAGSQGVGAGASPA